MFSNQPNDASGPGELDLSFGEGGVVTLDVGNWPYVEATDVVSHEGMTYVVGTIYLSLQPVMQAKYFIAAFLDNGAPAPFGKNGVVMGDFAKLDGEPTTANSFGDAISIQDGKILVAGHVEIGSQGKFSYYPALASHHLSGDLDLAFGENSTGTVIFPGLVGSRSEADASELEPPTAPRFLWDQRAYVKLARSGGKIYLMGLSVLLDGAVVCCFDDRGRIDWNFGAENGLAIVKPFDHGQGRKYIMPRAFLATPTGLVVGGETLEVYAVAAGLTYEGVMDTQFGNDGYFYNESLGIARYEGLGYVGGVNGFVLGAGSAGFGGSVTAEAALYGFSETGESNPGFNGGEPLLSNFGGLTTVWTGVLARPDHITTYGGIVNADRNAFPILARYTHAGEFDHGFGELDEAGGRKGWIALRWEETHFINAAVQQDASIYAICRQGNTQASNKVMLLRFHA